MRWGHPGTACREPIAQPPGSETRASLALPFSGLEAERIMLFFFRLSLIARDFSEAMFETRSTASANMRRSTVIDLSLPVGITR